MDEFSKFANLGGLGDFDYGMDARRGLMRLQVSDTGWAAVAAELPGMDLQAGPEEMGRMAQC